MSNVNGHDAAAEKKSEPRGWTGVNLDGTLAHYDGWKGADHIGEPVPAMVRKVKAWLAEGQDVRIFTARVSKRLELDDSSPTEELREADRVQVMIQDWSEKHIGVRLPVTCSKDYGMIMLYDDRCTFVFPNEGITHKEHMGFLQAEFLNVANALGVRVRDGANFKEVADECAVKARAGATMRGQQYEAVLALLDGCEDSVAHAITDPALLKSDLHRALQQLRRALPLLRELAGKKAP
jgi:hypothetical protein